jgi:GNAT superfamily N-acetyltransferase
LGALTGRRARPHGLAEAPAPFEPLHPPRPIRPGDDVSRFDCGRPELDAWLRRRALANEAAGGSRTYVVAARERVVAYYALAAGAVETAVAPGRIRRNMPAPVPVVVLGRLAVDRAFARRGIGSGLLRDGVLRTLQAAEIVGVRALLVQAIDDHAAGFYERHGLVRSPIAPLTLMIALKDAAGALR